MIFLASFIALDSDALLFAKSCACCRTRCSSSLASRQAACASRRLASISRACWFRAFSSSVCCVARMVLTVFCHRSFSLSNCPRSLTLSMLALASSSLRRSSCSLLTVRSISTCCADLCNAASSASTRPSRPSRANRSALSALRSFVCSSFVVVTRRISARRACRSRCSMSRSCRTTSSSPCSAVTSDALAHSCHLRSFVASSMAADAFADAVPTRSRDLSASAMYL
mmetsp:Transcript_10034/g.45979  ORF Transcript_10034/g.45979 Transcript_10034/m.45979 type:complete len:227 (+) Transcript_10034:1960-2640(+)